MTLYRQLVIFTLILFALLFSGTWLAKLESTRSFLLDQLASHAQDTATSLGVSISQHFQEDDMSAVETLVNAVFDRGYYMDIIIKDTDQNILLKQSLGVTIENVPQWFIKRVPLKTPEASANIMKGWGKVGSIYVKSHPGYAYKTLWENAVHLTIWYAVVGLIVAIAGGFGLRVLLKPLKQVERQAEALCNKQYEIQKKLPRTNELRRVVEAMNRMTSKVKNMFEEQVGVAERLREFAYRDPLTGLGNRRYFESQIKSYLESSERDKKGIILLVQIQDLQKLNQQRGFQAGDELLMRVAQVLREITKAASSCALARRLSGGDFGVFVPDASSWDAEVIAASIVKSLSKLAAEKIPFSDNVGHVGAVTYDFSVSLERLMSEADLALRTAQQEGPNSWKVSILAQDSKEKPLGEQQWKAAISKALQEREITLFCQTVVDSKDKSSIEHLEVFSRIVREDGNLLNAGVFMPFAERLNLVSTLDRIVLEQIMGINKDTYGVDCIAVNISPTSLRDDSFIQWTKSALNILPKEAPRIIFEFAEFGAVQNLDLVKKFGSMVRQFGHGIGLDHYGQSFSNLGYLKSLKPDYVKIDRAYTGELKDQESDSLFFISSLCSVAHSIDIAVIAEGVETEYQLEMLENLKIDGVQGYFFDRPKPISERISSV
ncbi:MAG: EAL domain-containing protein [Desulfobulbaceae bacterium]|uniref:EAL domain-containing protein n=1 Tax=Candidatus Desulfobia pelagia TaxID=2841692 RepID=A0A8J6NE49_9BACT|nr:EAL domain-containing protein [Candidatus Desulfobia pelagia]